MNITKEQADRVTVLAVRIAVWLPGESETGRALKNDAAEIADIMRGLAEDAEPVARVAEVHMSRYTLEWLNGPLPEGTELYTSPQAAQTEAIDKREAALCEMVRLSENLGLYEKDFPKTEEQEREAFEAFIRKGGGDLRTFGEGSNKHYFNSAVNHEWIGWKAGRAGSKP